MSQNDIIEKQKTVFVYKGDEYSSRAEAHMKKMREELDDFISKNGGRETLEAVEELISMYGDQFLDKLGRFIYARQDFNKEVRS
jgi:hypothetical protein